MKTMEERRHNYKKRSRWAIVGLAIMAGSVLSGCNQAPSNLSKGVGAFWGDNTTIYVVKNLQNGYKISIADNMDITLVHFERGDTISRYCSIELLPEVISDMAVETKGTFMIDINIPVVKVDTLNDKTTPNTDFFFMDVNFDGQEEFVQALGGNGWIGYMCYDLVNGRCLVEPLKDEPYNGLSVGIEPMQSGYCVFDYQKKELFIHHGSGCCAYNNTWAKYFEGDSLGNHPSVKVVKEEHHSFCGEEETIETYVLQGDMLKLTSITKQEY